MVPALWAEDELLNAKDTGPVGPNCASCHPYDIMDQNHQFHLWGANVRDKMEQERPGLNNRVTCLDCHYRAIAHFGFGGSREYRPVPYGEVDTSRGAALGAEVDALIASYAQTQKLVPWRTSTLHFDGKVDVDFPPNVASTAPNPATAYNPRNMTCSALACHESLSDAYKW